jgi:hypothetical protein
MFMAVYNWMEFYLGSVGVMQSCNSCLYDSCGKVEIPVFDKHETSNDGYAKELLDSCRALRDLSESMATENAAVANELFSTYQFTDPDDGKVKLHIMSANPNADIVSVTPCNGYMKVKILYPCGYCKKDCTGRRRPNKKKPAFKSDCIKFAAWETFIRKMRG